MCVLYLLLCDGYLFQVIWAEILWNVSFCDYFCYPCCVLFYRAYLLCCEFYSLIWNFGYLFKQMLFLLFHFIFYLTFCWLTYDCPVWCPLVWRLWLFVECKFGSLFCSWFLLFLLWLWFIIVRFVWFIVIWWNGMNSVHDILRVVGGRYIG